MARRNPRQQRRRRQQDPMGALQGGTEATLPQNPNHFLNRFPSFQDYMSHVADRPNVTPLSRQQYKGLTPRRRQQGGGGGGGGGGLQPDFSQPPSSNIPPIIPPAATPQPTAGTTDWAAGYAPWTGSAADWWAQNVPLVQQSGNYANPQHSAIQGGVSTPQSRAYWNQPAGQNDWTTAEWLYQPGTMPTNWSQFQQDYGALAPSTGTQDEWTALPYGYHTNPVNYSHTYNPGMGGFTPADVTAWKNAAPNTTNYLDVGEQFQGQTLNAAPGAPLGFRGPRGNIYGAPTRDQAYANPVAPDYYAPYQELHMLRNMLGSPTSGGDTNSFNDEQQRQIAANWFGSGGRGSLGELDYQRYLMGTYGPAGNPWEQFATQHGGITATQRYAGG